MPETAPTADAPAETTETTETTESTESAGRGRGTVAPPSVLSRPTDAAARPGFRSPPNNKSKAQKKRK